MTETTLHLETVQPNHGEALIQLLIAAFRNQFKGCQTIEDEPIRLFVEQRLNSSVQEPFSHRIVACLDQKIVGTLSLTWKPNSGEKKTKNTLFSKEMFHAWGGWKLFSLAYALHLIKHKPMAQECYIADMFVLPEYRGQGIETCLIQWACEFAKQEGKFNLLSFHLHGKDKKTAQLFETFLFRTCLQKGSFAHAVLFKDYRWNYMALAL